MMNRVFTSGICLLFILTLWSCSRKDPAIPDNVLSKPQSITALRKVQLKDNLRFGATAIKAVVISDINSKNIADGTLIVQQEGKDAAVVVKMDGNTGQYTLGSEVEINMEGGSLSLENGELIVSGLGADQVTLTGKTVELAPKVTNLSTVLLNAEFWGPILVKLEKITISGGEEGKLKGELALSDGLETVYSTILSSADFAGNEAPEFVEAYAGIVRMQNDKIWVNPRSIADIQVGLKEMLEDFEDASNTSYDVKTLDFRTGTWTIDGGITAATSADLKNGKQSIRLQGTVGNAKRQGILAMEFDLKGVKKLKISHGIYPASAETSNVNPTTFNVEVSKDGGLTYTSLKQIAVDIKAGTLKTDEVEVNAGFSENVRFRFVNTSTPFSNNNKPRISLDDVVFEF